jgi:large conductance mechanosensitive channel
MIQEFKDFALKGNALDLAIGVVIAGAFGKIVDSLVTDIIMPVFGAILKGVDFSSLVLVLNGEAAIKYGSFINVVINFIIVAAALFMVVKQLNRFKKAEAAK